MPLIVAWVAIRAAFPLASYAFVTRYGGQKESCYATNLFRNLIDSRLYGTGLVPLLGVQAPPHKVSKSTRGLLARSWLGFSDINAMVSRRGAANLSDEGKSVFCEAPSTTTGKKKGGGHRHDQRHVQRAR